MPEATVAHPRRGSSVVSGALWIVFIVVGWLVFAYLAFGAPGGLAAAWTAVHSLTLYLQVILWLLLLPWMVSLWIANSTMALWLRAALILMIFVATFAITIPSFLDSVRKAR